jgi:phosphoribosylaminoimidazole carboxylase PurK protein
VEPAVEQVGERSGRPVVGIVGAGQLARMTIEAASALGINVILLAESAEDAATEFASQVLVGEPRDHGQLWALAARCDVITFDHEHVDLDQLATFEEAGVAVWPSVEAMHLGVDKAHMRATLVEAEIPVPAFVVLADTEGTGSVLDRLAAFGNGAGWPLVLKATRDGYDGKGVWPVADIGEAAIVCRRAHEEGIVLMAEELVPITAELCALVVRGPTGTSAWPVVQTHQVNGICREVSYPGTIPQDVADEAQRLAVRLADSIGLVGVMAVEMFLAKRRLVVNEVAVRPHNSGHWTIEGSNTSQFENHLRAILGLPLGTTEPRSPYAVMVNVLGDDEGTDPSLHLADALAVRGAHVHLYGKEPRPGRKLGHVTTCGIDPTDVRERAWQAARALRTPVPAAPATAASQ